MYGLSMPSLHLLFHHMVGEIPLPALPGLLFLSLVLVREKPVFTMSCK
jgi:hypothetical protein